MQIVIGCCQNCDKLTSCIDCKKCEDCIDCYSCIQMNMLKITGFIGKSKNSVRE